ncbi:hypothetical protein OH492_28655 [Vibrio chagasii]|nr:hypothetical protein [Vibrio chagasii]
MVPVLAAYTAYLLADKPAYLGPPPLRALLQTSPFQALRSAPLRLDVATQRAGVKEHVRLGPRHWLHLLYLLHLGDWYFGSGCFDVPFVIGNRAGS